MGGSTSKKGVGGGLLEGGEDRGKVLYKGFDRFGGAGGVLAVVNGKVGLKDGVVGGEGVTKVDIIVRLAVCPVNEGIGQLNELVGVSVAVCDEVRHLVKGGEQRSTQQLYIVKVKNSMHGHHRFDDLHRRYVYCGVSVVLQFRKPFSIEASHQDLGKIGLALNAEKELWIFKLMNSTDGVVVRGGRFGGFKVSGAGANGGSAEGDFGHADSGNVTKAVEDFKDGGGVGNFRDDVVLEISPRIVVRDHVRAAVLVQEWADEGCHIDNLFVPLEDVSGGVIMKRLLHDVGRGFGCCSE